MSAALILGILAGLAIGGPLYYAYKVFTGKRKLAARRQLREEMMRQEQAEQQEETQPAEKPTEEPVEEQPAEEPVEEQPRP